MDQLAADIEDESAKPENDQKKDDYVEGSHDGTYTTCPMGIRWELQTTAASHSGV